MTNNLNCLQTESKLSNAFFSESNKKILQNNIRYLVFKKSGNKIKVSNQSPDELMTVMRSIYFSEAKNLPNRIGEQVVCLNKSVLKYCVNNVLSSAMQHQKYMEDIKQEKYVQSLPDRAISVSNRKQLEYGNPW